MPATTGVILDATHRDFVQQGVSMLAASRTADNMPCVSRATGCQVLDDNRLLIYLPTSRSAGLLKAIGESRSIAVVFSEPSSHKTIQVKGDDADVIAVGDGDESLLAPYIAGFCKRITDLDYPYAMAHALVGVAAADVTSVVFTPTAVFEQTPGPRAGEPLVSVQ